jgi:hypothetical protein
MKAHQTKCPQAKAAMKAVPKVKGGGIVSAPTKFMAPSEFGDASGLIACLFT